MLSVIFWADRALLAGQNPYQHFYVAERIYDFPYLPGMLLAFAPVQALHFDLRWAAIAYIVGAMSLVYWAALPAIPSAGGVVDWALRALSISAIPTRTLYAGHFLSLVVIFVLMQRQRFAWSAVAFGVSMVISQFSWVIFPFFSSQCFAKRWLEGGWPHVTDCRGCGGSVDAPFIGYGAGHIAQNAVGQWDRLKRPIARPMNLSYWASFVVRPSHLKWVQLVLLSGIFGFCWLREQCADLTDTLRWMIWALLTFILLQRACRRIFQPDASGSDAGLYLRCPMAGGGRPGSRSNPRHQQPIYRKPDASSFTLPVQNLNHPFERLQQVYGCTNLAKRGLSCKSLSGFHARISHRFHSL